MRLYFYVDLCNSGYLIANLWVEHSTWEWIYHETKKKSTGIFYIEEKGEKTEGVFLVHLLIFSTRIFTIFD